MKKMYIYETLIGKIGIAGTHEKITDIFLNNPEQITGIDIEETELIRRASIQLSEYFSGERTRFDLPIEAEGSDFEKTVWNALLTIPYGETRSYGDIARQIGKPSYSRAVGRANGRNPISIIIPCHRVIGADGTLTGYGGGLELKAKLLKIEHTKLISCTESYSMA